MAKKQYSGRQQCGHIRRDGKPCEALATRSSNYTTCFVHDESRRQDVAIAQRNGGFARHGRKVISVTEVRRVLEAVLKVLENGDFEPHINRVSKNGTGQWRETN